MKYILHGDIRRSAMEEIIREMIKKAIYYREKLGFVDEANDLLRFARDLIDRFSMTINCPSNWRNIGTELAEEYKENSWVFDELELWNYEEK